MRCPQTIEVGAYVLGALPPAERDAFERHLGECEICRAEVADLAVLPGLLGRLDAATAEAIARDGEASPALRRDESERRWAGPTRAAAPAAAGELAQPRGTQPPDQRWAGPTIASLVDAARRRQAAQRRRRRIGMVVVGLAAACLAVLVGLGVPRLLDRQPAAPTLVAMSQVAAAPSPVAAQLALVPFDNGTKVIMHCTYNQGSDRGRWILRLVVVPRAGGPGEEIGNWTAGWGDTVDVTAYSRLMPQDMDRVELRRGDGTPLLVYRPQAAATRSPTGPPAPSPTRTLSPSPTR
jgi:anti-sigma factor RsiW